MLELLKCINKLIHTGSKYCIITDGIQYTLKFVYITGLPDNTVVSDLEYGQMENFLEKTFYDLSDIV